MCWFCFLFLYNFQILEDTNDVNNCHYFWALPPLMSYFRPDVMQLNNRVLSLSHTHTHTHTLSLSLSHTHTHTLSLSLSLSLSLFLGVFFLTIWLFASLQNSLTCVTHNSRCLSLSLSLSVCAMEERGEERRGEERPVRSFGASLWIICLSLSSSSCIYRYT